MAHGDDDGLILPPRIASSQLVIIPLIHNPEQREKILAYCRALKEKLEAISYHGHPITAKLDEGEERSGDKIWGWIKKGVPLRIEVGARELDQGNLSVTKRTKGHKEIKMQTEEELLRTLTSQLDAVQQELFERAHAFQQRHLIKLDTEEEFYHFFNEKRFPIGFALTHWNGSKAVEEKIKQDLNVTIRCIPFEGAGESGSCPFTKEKSAQRVVFAKAY